MELPAVSTCIIFVYRFSGFFCTIACWYGQKKFHECLTDNFIHAVLRLKILLLNLDGHYIAYCRNNLNNRWYEFDDQSVTEVTESTVQNAEAYVLFYR